MTRQPADTSRPDLRTIIRKTIPPDWSDIVTTPEQIAHQQPTLDSATRSSTKRRRHQVQPRRRRESGLRYVIHSAAAPHRSSNQTRNQRYRRLFSYLDRASSTPRKQGYTAPSQRSFTPRPTRPSRHTTIIFRPSRLTSLLTHPVSPIPDRFRSHPTQQTIITRVTTSLFPIPNFHHRPNDLLNVAGHTPNTLIATFITLVTSAVLKTIGR